MKRILLLARALRKIGTGRKSETRPESKAVGDATPVLLALGGAALAVLMFLAGRFLGGLGGLIPTGDLFRTVYLGMSVTLLFLTLLDLINGLYMSTDNTLLVSLPFTPLQIVLARTLNCARPKILTAWIAVLPLGLAYGLRAGEGAGFWVSLAANLLLDPLMAFSLGGLIIIVLLSLFNFIRNRDLLAVIGAVLALLASIVYIITVNSDREITAEAAVQAVSGVVNAVGGSSWVIPSIPLLCAPMTGQSPLLFPLGVLVTAAVIALFLLAADKLYLGGLLRMQDTASVKRKLSRSAVDKRCVNRGATRGYARKELLTVFRNPAFITNGWLISLIWPVLLLLPMLMGKNSISGVGEHLTPAGVRELVNLPAMGTVLFRAAAALGLMLGVTPAAFSSLSSNALDREGKSFFLMKTWPVPYSRQIRAKRNAALLIPMIAGPGYGLLAAAVLAVLGYPLKLVLWILYAAALAVPVQMLLVAFLIRMDLRKPNLNWQSESSIAKRNTLGVIIWLVVFLGGMTAAIFLPEKFTRIAGTFWIPAAILFVLFTVCAVLMNRSLMRYADRRLEEI